MSDDIMRVLGRIEGKLDGQGSHIESVSQKATRIEGKLDGHVNNNKDAHGAGTSHRTWVWVKDLALVAIALGALVAKLH